MEHTSAKTLERISFALLIIFAITRLPILAVACGIVLFILVADFARVGNALGRGFVRFAEAVGNFLSYFTLIIIFYLFITPYSFVIRLFRKKDMTAFADYKEEALFREDENKYPPESFTFPW